RQPRTFAPRAVTLGAASVARLGVAGSGGERDSHSSVGPTTEPTSESAGRAVGNVDQHNHARPRGRESRLGSTPAHGGKPEWEHRPADLGSPRQPVLPLLPR